MHYCSSNNWGTQRMVKYINKGPVIIATLKIGIRHDNLCALLLELGTLQQHQGTTDSCNACRAILATILAIIYNGAAVKNWSVVPIGKHPHCSVFFRAMVDQL